ncbi:MAG: polysaccharide deacetylase family protein [Burkholderiales bacterium]
MYHHVSPTPGLVTVSPQTFAAQMRYLAEQGFDTLRADQLLAFIQGSKDLDKPSVLITFDDGYLDNYVYAYPTLKHHGLCATIFGITGWFGDGAPRTPRSQTRQSTSPSHSTCMDAIRDGRHDEVMLRWSEIEKMEADRTIEVHSHTHTHTRWDRTVANPETRHRALKQDLLASRDALKHRLGHDSRHLCWPQGYYDSDYRRTAQACGFTALYTTEKRIVTKSSNTETIGRIVVKDRVDHWLARRLWLYSQPEIGAMYTYLRGA